MSLISLIVSIAIAGFLVYLALQIPLPQVFKNVIIGLVTLFLVLWVLQELGVNTGFHLRLR